MADRPDQPGAVFGARGDGALKGQPPPKQPDHYGWRTYLDTALVELLANVALAKAIDVEEKHAAPPVEGVLQGFLSSSLTALGMTIAQKGRLIVCAGPFPWKGARSASHRPTRTLVGSVADTKGIR
jgi:hypothetical protein